MLAHDRGFVKRLVRVIVCSSTSTLLCSFFDEFANVSRDIYDDYLQRRVCTTLKKHTPINPSSPQGLWRVETQA